MYPDPLISDFTYFARFSRTVTSKGWGMVLHKEKAMEKKEIILLVREMERRIEELREQEGNGFDLVVDLEEWTNPRYNHQN